MIIIDFYTQGLFSVNQQQTQ